jgi:C4-dicarboxylate-specific signal transduction histidine kinase
MDMTLATDGFEAWIEVSDSGPGFPPRMLSSHLAHPLPTSDMQTEMGLTMTRSILAQFQGRLSLENLQGGGARVRMTLPLQEVQRKG